MNRDYEFYSTAAVLVVVVFFGVTYGDSLLWLVLAVGLMSVTHKYIKATHWDACRVADGGPIPPQYLSDPDFKSRVVDILAETEYDCRKGIENAEMDLYDAEDKLSYWNVQLEEHLELKKAVLKKFK